jgi:hypothetical protein
MQSVTLKSDETMETPSVKTILLIMILMTIQCGNVTVKHDH